MNSADLAPQCAGLAALSLGLSRVYQDDHEMLAHGMVMYDALYAWCRTSQPAAAAVNGVSSSPAATAAAAASTRPAA